MNSSIPILINRLSFWPWLCSASPALAAIALASLAVHGWILGKSAPISENTGPLLFEFHLLVMGLLFLFAIYVAGPVWLLLFLKEKSPPHLPTFVLQIGTFIIGWLLVFGAELLLESSPASRAF